MQNDKKMKSISFQDIISKAGGFGRYQKLVVFVFTGFVLMPSCLHNIGIVFLAAVPDYWCRSPPSVDHLNLTAADRLNLTVPREEVDGETVFSRCRRYDRNYTGWSDAQTREALVSGVGPEVNTTTCTDGWQYDQSVYTSSIVTQWGLVCQYDVLIATSSSVYYAGFMAGVLFFGSVADRFGRRVSLRIAVGILWVSSVCVTFSPNFIVFLCLRFAVAFATLGGFTAAYVAALEMVSPEWRMLAHMVQGYYWSVGTLIVPTLAYYIRDWVTLQIAFTVIGIISSVPCLAMSESPRWMYSQGRNEEGDEIVRMIAKVNRKTLPEDFKVVVKTDSKRSYVWDLLRTPGLRWRTLTLFFGWFVVSMTYYGLTLNTSNLGGDDHINAFISGALELASTILNHITLVFFGRRRVLAGNFVLGGLCLLVILAIPKGETMVITSLALAGRFFISAAFGTIYIVSAEQYPTVVRSIGVGASSFCARVGAIIAPYIGRLITVSWIIPGVTFGSLSILAGLLTLRLPETKGRELSETLHDGRYFDRKPPPKPAAAVDNPAFEKTSL